MVTRRREGAQEWPRKDREREEEAKVKSKMAEASPRGKFDAEQLRRARADPKIQEILQDPQMIEFHNLLQDNTPRSCG